MIKKFTSRKFIAMLAGLFTGLGLILSGETTEGVIAVLVSIGSYMTAEGYIDCKTIEAVQKTTNAANAAVSAAADELYKAGETK